MSPRFHAVALAAVAFLLGGAYSGAAAAAQTVCPDNGTALQANCTKRIRVYNNTDNTIYVVLEGTKQLTDAIGANCQKTDKLNSGGDVWLQAGLQDYSKCYPVQNDYYVYVNPKSGIPKGGFAAINVPWWSKRPAGAPDQYVDWWRGGRVLVFDDKTALDDSYSKLTDADRATFTTTSPLVACTKAAPNNACLPGELQIFQIPDAAEIGKYTPYQLNEFTFADVAPVTGPTPPGPGAFLDFNQGYNVSNVDQVYLPIAIEPIRDPADVGYIGTTALTSNFRDILAKFTGSAPNLQWPVYNNKKADGTVIYPNAGIRVPSPAEAFNYYMNPGTFPDGKTPEIIPDAPPKLLQDMIDQWKACVAGKGNCPESDIYTEINNVFQSNYTQYIKAPNCTPPDYLNPLTDNALLRFVYGWVPFNVACTGNLSVFDLPTVVNGNRAALDYIHLQYNYEDSTLPSTEWFNPYTHLIHAATADGGLDAAAYAFSIDDQASFVSNNGGTLPGGLIIAVGGPTGLQNGTPLPPPAPGYYNYFDFSVGLGGAPNMTTKWAKYGVCSDDATIPFRPSDTGGYVFGVDPKFQKFPCTISLTDTANNKYQVTVLQGTAVPSGSPPDTSKIWPFYCAKNCSGFDKAVVSCPSGAGIVPPAKWCNNINETTDKTTPAFGISAPPPLQ
jgi:hypothetical protein